MPLLSFVRSPAAVEYYAEDFRYFRRDVKLTRLASVLDRLLELDILHAEITASQDEPVIILGSGDIAVGPRTASNQSITIESWHRTSSATVYRLSLIRLIFPCEPHP